MLGERVAHHAGVRRIEAGDRVAITDGVGTVAHGHVARITKREIEVSIDHAEPVAVPPPLRLLAPVADRDRMLWLAEKATELGITSWQSVRFRRSASVSPRGEGPAFGEKLRARMIGALEQSFGAWLPVILPDATPASVEAGDGVTLVLDPRGDALLDVVSPRDIASSVLVGPEGGIEEEELDRLVAGGWRLASLGSAILRFETAAVSAAAIIRAVHASNPSHGVPSRGQ